MSKPFELYSPYDFKMLEGLTPLQCENVAKVANNIVNERSLHVYSSEYIPQSGGHSISTSKYSRDTHEALVVCSRYIEPEKVGCEVSHNSYKTLGWNYCPSCGEELK